MLVPEIRHYQERNPAQHLAVQHPSAPPDLSIRHEVRCGLVPTWPLVCWRIRQTQRFPIRRVLSQLVDKKSARLALSEMCCQLLRAAALEVFEPVDWQWAAHGQLSGESKSASTTARIARASSTDSEHSTI